VVVVLVDDPAAVARWTAALALLLAAGKPETEAA